MTKTYAWDRHTNLVETGEDDPVVANLDPEEEETGDPEEPGEPDPTNPGDGDEGGTDSNPNPWL